MFLSAGISASFWQEHPPSLLCFPAEQVDDVSPSPCQSVPFNVVCTTHNQRISRAFPWLSPDLIASKASIVSFEGQLGWILGLPADWHKRKQREKSHRFRSFKLFWTWSPSGLLNVPSRSWTCTISSWNQWQHIEVIQWICFSGALEHDFKSMQGSSYITNSSSHFTNGTNLGKTGSNSWLTWSRWVLETDTWLLRNLSGIFGWCKKALSACHI